MKYCSNCGAPLPDETRFCGSCGAPVAPGNPVAAPVASPVEEPAAQPAPDAGPAYYDSPRVRLCEDGKYRWTSAMNMYRNPSVFITVCKIFGILGGIAFGIFVVTSLIDGTFSEFLGNLKYWGIAVLVFLVIAGIAYAIVAGMYGGKYVVRFTMDQNGLLHEQIPEQAIKARKLGSVVAGAGVLTGSIGRAGQGMMVAAHTSLSSDFSKVRSIKPQRRWNTIKVNEPFANNQVYTTPEDFDFVLEYISSHCPKVNKKS